MTSSSPAPTPVGAPGWLAEVKERQRLAAATGEHTAEVVRQDVPALAAALEAVLALAGEWRDPEDDGLPSSALSEDRAWVRARCAESLSEAIETALRDAQEANGG